MKAGSTRRDWLATLGLGLAAGASAAPGAHAEALSADAGFGFCLNTSTLRGENLGIVEKVEIAAKAGYQGIEPWIREIDDYVKAGRSPEDLGKRIRDRGMTVEDAIGFFDWCVDDDARRRKGFDEAKRSMELVRRIGGHRIAAPPAGATDRGDLDLRRIAERYRALLELGETMEVVPQVEVWGFSKTLGRLGEAAYVAIDAAHPKACILPDVYHLYRGGSGFDGLKLLGREAIHVFHFNDYPATPQREALTDAHRVYPGDGSAPLAEVVRTLRAIGFRGVLSLELFNRDYWAQDPLVVARTGLEKMRAVVRRGLASRPGADIVAGQGI